MLRELVCFLNLTMPVLKMGWKLFVLLLMHFNDIFFQGQVSNTCITVITNSQSNESIMNNQSRTNRQKIKRIKPIRTIRTISTIRIAIRITKAIRILRVITTIINVHLRKSLSHHYHATIAASALLFFSQGLWNSQLLLWYNHQM